MRQCCVCNSQFERYHPIEEKYMQNTLAGQKDLGHITKNETLNMYEYECPQCYALDRDRLVVLFLQELFDKCLKTRTKFIPLKILDIAPSAPVGKWIKNNIGFCEYTTTDLFMENVDYNLDSRKRDDEFLPRLAETP